MLFCGVQHRLWRLQHNDIIINMLIQPFKFLICGIALVFSVAMAKSSLITTATVTVRAIKMPEMNDNNNCLK